MSIFYIFIYVHVLLKELLFVEDFKTQAKKFEAGGISRQIVDDYIKKFKKIRDAKYKVARDAEIEGLNVPKGNSRFDIDKYQDFHQLEMLVDFVQGQIAGLAQKGKEFTDIKVDGEPLGKKNGLEIYYAKDKHACITYKGSRPYSWCVARDDASNMYNTYRYKQHEPSFYFVKDVAATEEEFKTPFDGEFKNPWHFFVIQKTADGFIVTSANNDGDKQMDWNDILKVQPKLAGMEEYFKHVPLTPNERKQYERFRRGVDDSEFAKMSYEDKEAYLDIAVPNADLTDYKFSLLPDDLKNKYIGFGLGLSDGQFEQIKSNAPLFKRFVQISERKFQQSVKDGDYSEISIHPNEWKVLLHAPNASAILKPITHLMLMSFLLTNEDLDKIVHVVGSDKVKETLGLEHNATTYTSSANSDNLEKVAQLIGVDHQALDLYSIIRQGEEVPDMIRKMEFVIKRRGFLYASDAAFLIGSAHGDEPAIVNELLKHYKLGEIKFKSPPKPLQFRYSEEDDDAGYSEFFSKIFESTRNGGNIINDIKKIMSIVGEDKLKVISSDAMMSLIYGSIKEGSLLTFANIIGIQTIRGKLTSYQTAKVLTYASYGENTVNDMLTVLDPTIGDRMSAGDISAALYNANSKTIGPLANFFGTKNINKISIHDIESLLNSRGNYSDVGFLEIASIIIPACIDKIENYNTYSLLDKTRTQKHRDELCRMLIKYKGDSLTFRDQHSDAVAILTYTSEPANLARAIGQEKIDNFQPHSYYEILAQSLRPDASGVSGGNIVSEKIGVIGKNISKIPQAALNMLVERIYDPDIMSLLMKNIEAPTTWVIGMALKNVASIGNQEKLNDLVQLIGPQRMQALKEQELQWLLSGWMSKKLIFNALVPIYGREFLLSFMDKRGIRRDQLQEHQVYRNYFL